MWTLIIIYLLVSGFFSFLTWGVRSPIRTFLFFLTIGTPLAWVIISLPLIFIYSVLESLLEIRIPPLPGEIEMAYALIGGIIYAAVGTCKLWKT